MDPENAVEMVDEKTIFVVAILGSIVNGGMAKNDLAKKLGTKNNKIFHVLQGLESRRSIQLGQLQRLEIRKEDKTSFDNKNNDMEVASGNGVSE
nr:glutamate decarboxylase [Tanacetum cinerariifolium]